MMREPNEVLPPIDVGLNREEVEFMVVGFGQWFGPVRPEAVSAQLVGYGTTDEMADGISRLRDALRAGAALSRRDWKRVLIATELILGAMPSAQGSNGRSLLAATRCATSGC
jgi:hypothetical protein